MEASSDPTAGLTPARIDEILIADHRALEHTFTCMMAKFVGGDPDAIRAGWLELDRHLEAHLEAEEKYVLPRFEKHFPAEAARIRKEHRQIRSSLVQLGIDLDLHSLREDTAAIFISNLRRHAQSEEPLFYRWAQQHLPQPERASVIERLRTAYGVLRHHSESEPPKGVWR